MNTLNIKTKNLDFLFFLICFKKLIRKFDLQNKRIIQKTELLGIL